MTARVGTLCRRASVVFAAIAGAALAASSRAAPPGLVVDGGHWTRLTDARGTLKQTAEQGTALALDPNLAGAEGAWRCSVEPALGTQEAGLWFRRDRAGKAGFLCALVASPEGGGFVLRDLAGKTLWADEGASWNPYEAYVLEGIVEKDRVRAQLLRWDGRTLLSQSPWVPVAPAAAQAGYLGLHTLDGIARFWGAQRDGTPLSPLTDDAPNLRRLVQFPNPDWMVAGTGNWMWADGTKQWVRQYATADRAWALNRALKGSRGIWECHVRVSPGAGGAGMAILTDEERKQGFLCWLGGNFGAGCLMLYPLPGEALWASPQDLWHYDTEYALRAVVEEKSVRVALLRADGSTIVESPPVAVPPEQTSREGCLGLHTWIGMAEFRGFSAPSPAP